MYSLILNGRRSLDSQKWRSLRVSVKNFVQNAFAYTKSFSSVNVADVSPQGKNNFTVSYLVESLGLTTRLAESISRKVSFEDKVNADSVLKLLRSSGFKDSQISKIVRSYPQLLVTDAETSLRPKLQFLQSRGASSSELVEVVSEVPKILGKRGEKSISLCYDVVKDIMYNGKSFKYEKLCHSWPEGKKGNKIGNISALRELGVPQTRLFRLLISNGQPVCGKEKFEETLEKVVDICSIGTGGGLCLRVFSAVTLWNLESRDHIFFSCSFASLVWAALTRNLLGTRFTAVFSAILDLINDVSLTRSQQFLLRYVFQTSIYVTWQERNNRRHGAALLSVDHHIATIDRLVRNRIISFRRLTPTSFRTLTAFRNYVLMFSSILNGRRSLELQKWRNLRVSVSIVQNAFAFTKSFSSVNVADVSPQGKNTFTLSYLVESLGLTTRLAESISRKVSFEDKVNADSVLKLLRTNGFKDSQISKIVRTYPQLLVTDAETSLRPKLQILKSRGASSTELTEIVSNVPKILGKRGEKSICLYYDLVKEIMNDGKSFKYEKLCHSWPEGKARNKIRNVLVLRELGVPQKLLLPLLISYSQPVFGKEKFEETLKKVVDMGFDPAKPNFVEALHVIYEMSDKTIEEKVNVYKGLGFSEVEIWAIFKRWPFFLKFSEKKITRVFETLKKCGLVEEEVLSVLKRRPQCIRASEQTILDSFETFIGLGFSRDELKMMVKRDPQCTIYSAETVKKKLEFLVNKMNWPLEVVVMTPSVFGYSMDKRIVPRCNVIKALMSKGLIGSENPPISSVLVCSDQKFLNRYVMQHDKLVPKLMAIFTRDRVS